MQYLAYSNPPTSVSEAHKADFLVPGVDALVQIKSNRIEVHTLESTGLRLAVHGSIQGTVLRSVPVRLRGVPTCALAILTTDYILCVVAFQHSQPVSDSNASSGEYRIITLASQSVLERSASPAVDIVALLASDDDAAAAAAQPTRFLLIHAFQGLIRVIVLDDGEEQQLSAVQKPDKRRASRGAVASKDGETSVDLARGFTTRIPELLLTSLLILPRSASTSPHRLATIHTDRHGDRLLLLRNINLQTKALEFEEDASSAATSASPPFVPKTGLLLSDPDSEMMIPIQVHDKVQGIIIVGQDCTRFVHTGHVRRASVSSASMDIISEKSTMAESGVSSMSLEEEAMTGTQAPTSPTVSSAISKGKGKAKEVASPTLVAQTGAAGAGTAARRRSSAASQQPLATSPTSTLGMADPRAGYKRKLSESANSSGRGKATARVGADVVPNGKSIECSLPISQYVAHCTLDEDPNRFLLADSWGNVILLRLSVERSPPVKRSSVTQASPTTTTVPLASSPPSPSKAAMSPTSPAARPRPASRSSISSGSATDKLTTVKLSVEKVEAGKVSSPTALVNLGSNYIFVGSHLGDSLLVRLSPSAGPGEQDGGDMDIDSAPVKNGSTKDGGMELEILNAYTNLAPIVDFCVVETGDGKGPSHMVTCSGGKDDGTLRVIRHGVGMTDLASMDMEGVQRVWTINSGNVDEGCHDLLVLSHINETRILSFSGEAGSDDTSIEELDGLGSFRLSSPTLLAHSHASQIYQVTADAVIGPISAWSSGDGKKITLAAACEDFMLVALAGGVIALLRLGSAGKAEELGRQNLGNEVACLDVSRLRLANGSGIIAAAGLWNVYSVVTLSVPDLEVHETIKLDTTFLLRSVLSCTLSTEEERTPTSYLFIGLGDGTLVSYSYATSRNEGGLPRISESSRKNLALGNRPITLAKIATGAISAENDGPAPQASPAVLVASDRATIVSYANGKLSYSSANLSSTVSSVAAFNHLPAYASSLVICSQDQIQIGRVDELQKLHVKTLRLGDEAPRRIAHARTLKAYGVVFLKELLDSKTGELSRSSSFKLLDDSTFDVLADFPLERNEEARSVACLTLGGMEDDGASMAERFVVGTGFIEPDAEESKRGRVLVFEHAGEGSYRQVGEAETRGAVHAIAGLPDGKFAVTSNSEIIVYDWNASGELEYLTNWGASFIAYSLVSKGDLLCAVDPLRSVSLLRFDASTSKLIDIAKEFSAYGVFVAAFLEDASQSGEGASTGTETILAADLDLNLFTSKRMKATSVMTGSAAMSSANSRTADVETLKSQARIHVGEVVNKICKGSLVPSFSQTTTGAVPQVVFCTSVGSIGTVTTLSANTSSILSSVERNMRKVVPSVGHLKQSDYRAFKTEYHTDPAVGFIDGAFVEELLELSSEDVDRVMAGGTEHEKIIDASKEDVIRLIEELQRMH